MKTKKTSNKYIKKNIQTQRTAENKENKIKDLITKNENENSEMSNSEDGNLNIEQTILKKIKN